MNKVIIIGRLGQDPELRSTAGGMSVCKLSVATSERRKVGDEWKEHTEWHRVKVFGRQAESCAQYLAKGRQVGIEGKLQTEKWTDKTGADRYTTEIIADGVEFIGGREGGQGGQGGERRDPAGGRNTGGRQEGGGYGGGYGTHNGGGRDDAPPPNDDDIPF